MAHHLILDVYVSPNRKYVNLSIIYYITDFSFFMSQDDAYFHIYQNDPHCHRLKSRTSWCWVVLSQAGHTVPGGGVAKP